MAINNLTLFCRECVGLNMDDQGVCADCGTHNVLSQYEATLSFNAVGYTEEEALRNLFLALSNTPVEAFGEHVTLIRRK